MNPRIPVYSFPSARDFETWLRYGRKPGQKIAYHSGLLMADRQRHASLNDLARAVWKAYEQGRVALTQVRHGEGKYLYLATVL